jgi:hypothetical protein
VQSTDELSHLAQAARAVIARHRIRIAGQAVRLAAIGRNRASGAFRGSGSAQAREEARLRRLAAGGAGHVLVCRRATNRPGSETQLNSESTDATKANDEVAQAPMEKSELNMRLTGSWQALGAVRVAQDRRKAAGRAAQQTRTRTGSERGSDELSLPGIAVNRAALIRRVASRA